MKIFIDENIPLLQNALKVCGDIMVFQGRELNKNELISEECEFLFVRSTTKVGESLLDETNVQYVGSATSGTDHVDLKYLAHKNIKFSDARGSNANSVAEYVIYSVLKWCSVNKVDVNKKKIGIIGFGNIGRLVAEYSYKLGMDVLINDPPLLDDGFEFPNKFTYSDLDKIFRESDIITNHVPLNKEGNYPTSRLIDSELIKKIKDCSLFIHTSRGGVVDEQSLVEALVGRKLSAVLDVWEHEPLVNTLLCSLCFLSTPHIAGYSYDGKIKGVKMMADFLREVTGSIPDYTEIEDQLRNTAKLNDVIFKDSAKLLGILEDRRKFSEDYQNFLKTMLFKDEVRIKLFDDLRKNYPIRRESLGC